MYPDARTPPYLPVRTVVKFYQNHYATSQLPHEQAKVERNSLISKTLLKTVVIDDAWHPKPGLRAPVDKEFWMVDLVHETRAGEKRGCFIAHPLRQLDFAQMNRLLPGMFIERRVNGLLLLEPKLGGINWILPARHRNRILDVYAVVVVQ